MQDSQAIYALLGYTLLPEFQQPGKGHHLNLLVVHGMTFFIIRLTTITWQKVAKFIERQ